MSASFLVDGTRRPHLARLERSGIPHRVSCTRRGVIVTVGSKDAEQVSRVLQTRKR